MAQENKDRLVAQANVSLSDVDPTFVGQRGFVAGSGVRDSAGVYRISLDPRWPRDATRSLVHCTFFGADPLFVSANLTPGATEINILVTDTAGAPADPASGGVAAVSVWALSTTE